MQNRMNTVESTLNTDLNAESDITDEFITVERGFRDQIDDYRENELPALLVECFESNDEGIQRDDAISNYERESVVMAIIYQYAEIETARNKVKELISLCKDFLRSTSWTYYRHTNIGRGYIVEEIPIENNFKVVGIIELTVDMETAV